MEESITLHCTEGNSDKIYEIHLRAKDGGYILSAANGRRGNTLVPQPKITTPVSYTSAKREFENLLQSKLRKHYKPIRHWTGNNDGNNTPAAVPTTTTTGSNPAKTGTDNPTTGNPGNKPSTQFAGLFPEGIPARKDTGIRCQLLNEASEELLEKLLDDDTYGMEEKFDGRRLPAGKLDGKITASNRDGFEAGIPGEIHAVLKKLKGDHILDNEAIGETLHSFDLLKHDGLCMRAKPYRERRRLLQQVLEESRMLDKVKPTTIYTGAEKRAAFLKLKTGGAEGVVFKKMDATLTWGKKHGDQWKFKFVNTASCITTGKNPTKRSIQIELLDNGQAVPAGNVTVPPNMDIPEPGEVVEVQYLYALRKSGVLYQPVLLGIREDIPVEECVVEQLKYKNETLEPV